MNEKSERYLEASERIQRLKAAAKRASSEGRLAQEALRAAHREADALWDGLNAEEKAEVVMAKARA